MIVFWHVVDRRGIAPSSAGKLRKISGTDGFRCAQVPERGVEDKWLLDDFCMGIELTCEIFGISASLDISSRSLPSTTSAVLQLCELGRDTVRHSTMPTMLYADNALSDNALSQSTATIHCYNPLLQSTVACHRPGPMCTMNTRVLADACAAASGKKKGWSCL